MADLVYSLTLGAAWFRLVRPIAGPRLVAKVTCRRCLSDGIISPVTSNEAEPPHERYGHMGLTADEPDGRVVREMVPVKFHEDGLVEIIGSPALVTGCAAGDVLEVEADGRFKVIHRGPNLSVQAFSDPPFTHDAVAQLSTKLQPLGGCVEAPEHRRFLVATVPISAGQPRIDSIMAEWTAEHPETYWQYSITEHQTQAQQDSLW